MSTLDSSASSGDEEDDEDETGGPDGSPSVNDLFGQLNEFMWKGVPFPVEETELEVRQDLVIHKYADRNGAYVEGTGRHPVQITAVIPFLNNIYPATSEGWLPGTLYPFVWREFLKQCLEGTSGELQHPELGSLTCKLDLARTTWSGKVRGGVIVRATWIESDDEQADQLGNDLSNTSPVAAFAVANDLDANIEEYDGAVPSPLPAMSFSFDSLVSSIVGAIDSVTILEKQLQGRVDNLIYQCNRVKNSLDMASAASPLNWPIYQNLTRLKDAAWAVKLQPVTARKRQTKQLTVLKDSTFAQLIAQTNSDPGDFISLNYALMGQPVIPAGTVVLYYVAAT